MGLALIKQANFQPLDENSWVLFREFSRGWISWLPTVKDFISMKCIFSALPSFSKLQSQNPNWSTKNGRMSFPIFNRQSNAADWQLEWWNDDKIVRVSESLVVEVTSLPVNELNFNQAKTFKVEAGAIWEVYSFYAPSPESGKERGFFPEICVIMDCKHVRIFS